jgi:hypothetical protein
MAEGNGTSAGSDGTARRNQNDHGPHDDHGHSVAAWTLVSVALGGALVSSFAMVFNMPWLFWVGVGIIVVGVVIGKVLQSMGYGKKIYEDARATRRNRPQGVR